jgi:5-formyltetrahydrofolate cyclo-ligase
MVAFDGQRRRMGYGGGYYDRYLLKCSKAVKIGIAFEIQRMEELITDSYDCPMDMIITEENIY